MNQQRVVILGASDKPDRYAYKAFKMLQRHGHEVVPVHPVLSEIEGTPVLASLSDIQGGVETLTLYVNPSISSAATDAILALHPARVIFNPGTENPELAAKLETAGIPHQEACTLVLLATGQFV
jgi:predicted CoA-binding protein